MTAHAIISGDLPDIARSFMVQPPATDKMPRHIQRFGSKGTRRRCRQWQDCSEISNRIWPSRWRA